MDSKDPKIINFNKKKEEIKMKRDKENKQKANRGLKILAVTAVGAGLYGYRLGFNKGHTQGVSDGYTTAANEFIEVMKGLTEEIRESRGE